MPWRRTVQFLFEGEDKISHVNSDSMERLRRVHKVRQRRQRVRLERGIGQQCGSITCLRSIKRSEQVKTQQQQVIEVIVVDRLTLEVGMHHAQTAQPLPAERIVLRFRQQDTFLIADNDILDRAGAADQQGDLAAHFLREIDQQAGKVKRDNFRRRDLASVETFQLVQMEMLETA